MAAWVGEGVGSFITIAPGVGEGVGVVGGRGVRVGAGVDVGVRPAVGFGVGVGVEKRVGVACRDGIGVGAAVATGPWVGVLVDSTCATGSDAAVGVDLGVPAGVAGSSAAPPQLAASSALVIRTNSRTKCIGTTPDYSVLVGTCGASPNQPTTRPEREPQEKGDAYPVSYARASGNLPSGANREPELLRVLATPVWTAR